MSARRPGEHAPDSAAPAEPLGHSARRGASRSSIAAGLLAVVLFVLLPAATTSRASAATGAAPHRHHAVVLAAAATVDHSGSGRAEQPLTAAAGTERCGVRRTGTATTSPSAPRADHAARSPRTRGPPAAA